MSTITDRRRRSRPQLFNQPYGWVLAFCTKPECLVTASDERICRCDDQIEQAKERLEELRALIAAWHRRQWLRLGAR